MSLDSKILIKFTTRSRPDKFMPCINNVIEMANQPDKLIILVSIDSDDTTMYNQHHEFENLLIVTGRSKNKIYGINRDIRFIKEDWDILVNLSDDQLFVVQGYDDIIRADFNEFFPDFDGVMHYNDQHHYKKDLMAMSIIGRKYYNRFGYVYHPHYISLWCDNEAQEVAILLDKYAYNEIVLFHHNHPGWGCAPYDAQYIETEKWYGHDKKTFEERKSNNFDLVKINGKWYMKNEPVKLSIMILTIDSRKEVFDKLYDIFFAQAMDAKELCEIIYECDGGEMSKGQKRNILLEKAKGEYCAFFDDDDMPSDDYIEKVLDAIRSGVDCASLRGIITFDGKNPEIFEHSIKYDKWETLDGAKADEVKYLRYPNHLNAIKSSIAKQFKFPEINHGEDKSWSDAVYESGLIKTEGYIDSIIYHYLYKSAK